MVRAANAEVSALRALSRFLYDNTTKVTTQDVTHGLKASSELCQVLEQASQPVDRGAISLVIRRLVAGTESKSGRTTVDRSRLILVVRSVSRRRSLNWWWSVFRYRVARGVILVLWL